MEVLEIKPIKNKEISVYIIKRSNSNLDINILKKLVKIVEDLKIDFVTVDVDTENLRNFSKSLLTEQLDELKISYFPVNIPEYAIGYLFEDILEGKELMDDLIEEYQNAEDKQSFKSLNLKSWIDLLKMEIEEKKSFLSLKLRPQWIVKKILDTIRSWNKQKVSFIHIAQEEIFTETKQLLKELNFEVIIPELEREIIHFNVITNMEEMLDGSVRT